MLGVKVPCMVLSRSTVYTAYYKVKPFSTNKLGILNLIDEIYADNPEFGYRYIDKQMIVKLCKL